MNLTRADALELAVAKVLSADKWPIWRHYDDAGLSELHYCEFVAEVIAAVAAPQPETEEAMFMLQDVPGATLVERVARLSKWYLELKMAKGAIEHVLRRWQEKLADMEDMDARGDLTKDWGACSLMNARNIVNDLTAATATRPYADRAQSATAFDPELQADGDAEKRT